MVFLGIDLHTNCFTCCYLDESGSKRIEAFDLDTPGFDRFFPSLTKDTHVLVEATVNTFAFVQRFQHLVAQVIIANTHKLKIISFTDKKTDRVDAEKLARVIKAQVLSGEQQIHPVMVPSHLVQDLRALFSTYQLMRKQIVASKNRIHSLLSQNLFPFTKKFIFGKKSRELLRGITTDPILSFQLNFLFDMVEHLEWQVDQLVEKILVTAHPFMHEIELLTTMRGISTFTAVALMTDIETVTRFPNSKKFTAYLRSAPRVESSNTSTVIKSTNKTGRKLSIVLMLQSLNHFRDANPHLRDWNDRLGKYKRKGVVRMGLARKVFTHIYQMLKNNEPHHFADMASQRKKINAYRSLLRSYGITTGGQDTKTA
jgi:transposase